MDRQDEARDAETAMDAPVESGAMGWVLLVAFAAFSFAAGWFSQVLIDQFAAR